MNRQRSQTFSHSLVELVRSLSFGLKFKFLRDRNDHHELELEFEFEFELELELEEEERSRFRCLLINWRPKARCAQLALVLPLQHWRHIHRPAAWPAFSRTANPLAKTTLAPADNGVASRVKHGAPLSSSSLAARGLTSGIVTANERPRSPRLPPPTRAARYLAAAAGTAVAAAAAAATAAAPKHERRQPRMYLFIARRPLPSLKSASASTSAAAPARAAPPAAIMIRPNPLRPPPVRSRTSTGLGGRAEPSRAGGPLIGRATAPRQVDSWPARAVIPSAHANRPPAPTVGRLGGRARVWPAEISRRTCQRSSSPSSRLAPPAPLMPPAMSGPPNLKCGHENPLSRPVCLPGERVRTSPKRLAPLHQLARAPCLQTWPANSEADLYANRLRAPISGRPTC